MVLANREWCTLLLLGSLIAKLFRGFIRLVFSRSSNDEPTESLDDRERIRLQPHGDTLEATAQSIEQDVKDLGHKKAPSPSVVQQKVTAEKEIILLTSTGRSSSRV
jgi:hypothetical protein